MKSIHNPSSKVSTQWVSLVPIHNRWEFILCLHKYFTRPAPFQQLSSCNTYCITTCNQLGNIFIIFYPYSSLLQPLNFTIVHMPQVILVSQFKSCWRVPQVWVSVVLSPLTVGFCAASHAVPWRAFVYLPSVNISEPLISSGMSHDPTFLVAAQHRQSSPFIRVVPSGLQVQPAGKSVSCTQAATNVL